MAEPVQILTEKEIVRFAEWIKKLSPSDLETLSKLLFQQRQTQYKEWDKTILSNPLRKRRQG